MKTLRRRRSTSEGESSPRTRAASIRKIFRRTEEPSREDIVAKKTSVVNGRTLLVGEMKGDSIEVSIKAHGVLSSNGTGESLRVFPPVITECPSLTFTDSTTSSICTIESPIGSSSPTKTLEVTNEVQCGTSKPIAGSSTRRVDRLTANGPDKSKNLIEWRRVPGETIRVRPKDYLQNRNKAPSPGELYECIHVDFLESSNRIPNISGRVHIPTLHDDVPTVQKQNPWHAPDVFVVSMCLPVAATILKEDGPSCTITMYYKMKEQTRNFLQHIYSGDETSIAETKCHPLYNAVRLFDQWCFRAKDDPDFMARFKLITSMDNLEDLGLPTWISRWNGKPVLIKRSGTTGFLHQHPNCMEMEISLHPFPWATKKAIQYLMSSLSMLLNFGFVIEGRDEAELPEVVIGLCQLCYPLPEQAVSSETFFNQVVGK